jgi:hypothetical protein
VINEVKAQWIGTAILVLGLALASAVYLNTSPNDSDPDPYELNAGNSKRYAAALERIGGKSAVLGVEVEDGIASLFHGRKLAYTIATLSITGALLFFAFSKLTVHPLPVESAPPKP